NTGRFDDTGQPEPFLPLWQALADELKKLNPATDIKVVGGSSLMGIHPDGSVFPFTWQTVTHPDGRTEIRGVTLPDDNLYEATVLSEVPGRGPDDTLTPPRLRESPFRTTPPPPTFPQSSTFRPSPRGVTPEKLPWPSPAGSPLADADHWAATLKLTRRRYDQ